jgi:hypothetical protein
MRLAYSPLPPFRAADDAIADAVGPMLNYIGTIAFDLGASIQRPPQAKPQPEPEPKRDELSSLLAMDQDERRAWLHHQRANLAASKQLLAMTQDERREFIARVAEQNSDIHYRTHLGEQPERADSMLDPDSVVLYTQPLERPPMRATRADAVHMPSGSTAQRTAARRPAISLPTTIKPSVMAMRAARAMRVITSKPLWRVRCSIPIAARSMRPNSPTTDCETISSGAVGIYG